MLDITLGEALQVVLGIQEAALYKGYFEESKITIYKTVGEDRRLPLQYVTLRRALVSGLKSQQQSVNNITLT